ncbi:EamA domain-containing membrane protein RarD [Litoreibacter ascidiaceicola]|uniref:EamA domain-containing membrane protein RarD n=1 Tax=Litoreibacter ascidiaceicola TaxID=1486859 RepID=A0A1M4XYX6_9RHOB|nr:DMT family transporter [Litoreibacter ascidiaceicola]SHE98645.1 EamA domain-containing membrane protein RarD [Litoreibacter ascidiaceicola]
MKLSPTTLGPLFAAIAVTLFSLNDVTMKFLSGGYALHQIVLIRSIVGMAVVMLFMVPFQGGFAAIKTQRLGAQIARAGMVFFANMTFFLGLAALPLADAVALFFVSPFVITIFSVLFLGETVGARRWGAVAVGLIGVLIILRPGTSAFQPASLLPIAAAFGYGGLHIMTRYLRNTETTVSMVFYIQLMFILATCALGLLMGNGKFATTDNASLEFLFRPWVWPEPSDLPYILILGLFASVGGYFISLAYRMGEAALVAPFEYLALPLSIILGMLIFDEWPDAVAWAGIALILTSGLYTVWREHQLAKRQRPKREG